VVTLRIGKDIAGNTAVLAYFPVMLSQFLQQTSPVLEQADQALTPRELAVETERLNEAVEVDMEAALAGFKDYLQNTSLSQFWEEVFGKEDDPRRFRLIKNLTEILLPMRGQPPQQLALGLRFPLGRNETYAHQAVCFWILTTGRMLGNPQLNPTAFWGGSSRGAERFLFLFLRPPASKNLIQLGRPEAENDSVCHLEEEGEEVSPDRALSGLDPGLGSVFVEGDIALSDFLGYM
jgi:hypothetical protein